MIDFFNWRLEKRTCNLLVKLLYLTQGGREWGKKPLLLKEVGDGEQRDRHI